MEEVVVRGAVVGKLRLRLVRLVDGEDLVNRHCQPHRRHLPLHAARLCV